MLKNKVFWRSFIGIFLYIALAFAIVSGYYYYNYAINVNERLVESNERALLKTKDIMDMVFEELDYMSLRLSEDLLVEKFIDSKDMKPNKMSNIRLFNDLKKSLYMYTKYNHYIFNSYIFGYENGYVINSNGEVDESDGFMDIACYEVHQNNKNDIYSLIYYREAVVNQVNKKFITFSRNLPLKKSKALGLLVINVDVEELSHVLGDFDKEHTEYMFIMNKDNEVVYTNHMQREHKDEFGDYEYYSIVEAMSENETSKLMQDDLILISRVYSDYTGMKYISVVNLEGNPERQSSVFHIQVISTMGGILTILLAIFITMKSYKPLRKARQQVHKAQNIALQSQIKPHFLYNALNVINMITQSITKGENDASRAVTALASMLRITYKTDGNMIPIADEINHTKCYLDIEQLRFKSKIHVIWNVEESLYKYKTMKIVLQPVVENAIHHGIMKKEERRGNLLIKGVELKDKILLSVIDNGVGMGEDQLSELNARFDKLEIVEGDHIGLCNVDAKIRLYFGEKYGLSIRSKQERYTRVDISIPKI